ncbi:MAG: peptide synthase [Halobacteriovoraceae bacterium]|nr:peptide synthase [Halobacteriovoraceae bacterium]
MNVADQITEVAKLFPHKRSVVATDGKDRFGKYRYVHYTFEQLESKINQFSNALVDVGVKKGDKALLFVKPCLDFSALVFALFKVGAVPVLIDPGMGRKPFLRALESCGPRIMIGIPKAHVLRRLFPKVFKSVEIYLNYGNKSFLGAKSILALSSNKSQSFESVEVEANELGAILFTSGGTGRPKGVEYTHDIFISQTKALKEEFKLTKEDVDCPGFPLFAMFTLSMGMTSCIPDMDPSRPSEACPKSLEKIIKDQSVTFAAGSPAIWKNLGEYCVSENILLPTLRSLVMFGAPISIELHELFSKALPNGDTFTPYGATESLPVANAMGSAVLERKEQIRSGKGVYLGRPLSSVDVKVIADVEEAIESISDIKELPNNEIGEFLVKSRTTTKGYYQMPEKTKLAKVYDGESVWHRMGDVGHKDEDGNLWFLGRKAHKIVHEEKSHYSISIESIFNQHPEVEKSALISKEVPSIAIQRKDASISLTKAQANLFLNELLEIGKKYGHTKDFEQFYLCSKFPVDVRHNIKIDRKRLGEMKLERLR